MAFTGHDRRKQPRAERTGGNVSRYAQQRVDMRVMAIMSRYAQQRVDMRVMAIMSRRDAAARRDPHPHQPLIRPITSRT